MPKLVFAICAMWALYTVLDHHGATQAAAWLTGAIGFVVAIWFGLARA